MTHSKPFKRKFEQITEHYVAKGVSRAEAEAQAKMVVYDKIITSSRIPSAANNWMVRKEVNAKDRRRMVREHEYMHPPRLTKGYGWEDNMQRYRDALGHFTKFDVVQAVKAYHSWKALTTTGDVAAYHRWKAGQV